MEVRWGERWTIVDSDEDVSVSPTNTVHKPTQEHVAGNTSANWTPVLMRPLLTRSVTK